MLGMNEPSGKSAHQVPTKVHWPSKIGLPGAGDIAPHLAGGAGLGNRKSR